MANTVLASRNSRILNYPLTVSQQVWLSFLLPSIGEAIIYIFDIATDLAIGITFLRSQIWFPGGITLALIYLPPLISFILALFQPPEEKNCKSILKWLVIEFLAFIFFFMRPVNCFALRIFWSIEAARHKDPEREEALQEYDKTMTSCYLSNLFFQAFLQAGPQFLLQMCFVVWDIPREESTKVIQGVSMFFSLASIAASVAIYQRYETQCKGKRKRVWSPPTVKKDLLLSQSEPDHGSIQLPRRIRWTKVMETDNPLGVLISFIFWFLLILGRCLCLVMASTFYPWAVLGVCVGHYIFSFLYILPSPDCKTSIPLKIILGFLYIFCLIEVGVQFRKSFLFYTLFFVSTFIENFTLTMVWVLWGNWEGWWYHYTLGILFITHTLGLSLAITYARYFRPQTTRLKPNT